MITNQHNFFFDPAIQDAIVHAKEVFPDESCGAIIDDEYVRFDNQAEDKTKNFVIMDPYFDRSYQDNAIQAVIHSHNNDPAATAADQAQQIELEVPFGIVNLVNKSVTHLAFWGDSLPIEPLKRRHFFYGVWDCFSLVRDYFRIKHGVTFPNVPREYGFWLKNESIFENHIFNVDVVPVPLDEIRPNDVLFYNLHGSKFLNHCAVMKEDGLVLHHFENHCSQGYPISYSQQFLRFAYRVRGIS